MFTHNSKAEQHGEFVNRTNPPLPCTASHQTFGGKCMNCSFQPTMTEAQAKEQKYEDEWIMKLAEKHYSGFPFS